MNLGDSYEHKYCTVPIWDNEYTNSNRMPAAYTVFYT